MADGDVQRTDDIVDEQSLMNSICFRLIGTEYRNAEFIEARRDGENSLWRVAFQAQYSAGPATGEITLTCAVLDELNDLTGTFRVVDLMEDPYFTGFENQN